FYVYVLSGAGFGVTTHIGTVWGSQNEGWKTGVLDLQAYQGQTIQLWFRTDTDGYYSVVTRLDNLSLNIETPGWSLSDASLGSIQATDGISGAYLFLGQSSVSAYSIPFLVPTNTDSLRFNYFISTYRDPATARPLTVYAYSGDNFGVTTVLGTVYGSQNEGWKQATLNLTTLRGRTIKLRFLIDTDSYWNGTAKIDNVELLYGATGAPAGNYPNPGGAYLSLNRYEVSAYSAPFIVLSTTESVSFDYQNWSYRDSNTSRPLYVYALSGPNFEASTYWGAAWGSATEGWKQAAFSVTQQLRGQVIKLRFRSDTDSYWNGQSKIDNVTLIHGAGGSTGINTANPDGAYLSLNRYEVSAYSTPFLVPTGTQDLRFDYFNSTYRDTASSRPLYVYALPGPGFTDTVSLGTVWGSTLEGWKQAALNISAYQSQTVQLRFRTDTDSYWNTISKIDNVYLLPLSTAPYTITEINLPNYTSTTSDTLSIAAYGSANFTLDFGDYGVDRYNSTVEVTPLLPVADSVSAAIVTVTVRSGSNVPMAGQWVEVQAPGAAITITQPLNPTDAQGRAIATIRSTRAQSTLVSARTISDNVTLAQAVPITFTAGTPSAARSALAAQPDTVSANGVNTALIIVTLRDAFDNVVPNKVVTVTHTGTAISLNLNGNTTNGQGLLTSTVRSTQAQTVTLRARDLTDNITVTQSTTVRFTTVDPQQSSLVVVPNTVVANGTATAFVTVTLRDSAGVPLPNKPAQLLIDNTTYVNGQPAGSLVAIGSSASNGVVTAVVTSTVVGVKSISAYGDNVPLNMIAPITFTVGAVDVALSQLQSDRSAVVADGVNYATLTAIVVDNTGHPIPNQTVLIRSTGSQVTVAQPNSVTDAQGHVQATLKSTVVQNVVVSAFVPSENVTLTQTVNLAFLPGPADVTHSLVVMSPITLTANGTHWATITATLHDALDHPLSQRAIQLVTTGSSNFFQPVSVQNANAAGQVVFQMASTVAEAKQISVRDVAYNLNVPGGTLTFVPGVISPTLSTLSASPNPGAADGTTPVSIIVTVRDQYNNPIPGYTVALSATGSSAFTLTQPLSPTNSSGQAQGTLISGVSQVITVAAQANGVTLTQELPVRFVAADLLLEKFGPSQAAATFNLTYTLRLRNVGLVAAQNTILTDDLPANVTFITHTAPVAVNVQGQSLVWNFGTLNPNQTIEFQVVGYLEAGAGGSVITNLATATTSTADERLNNNQATLTTQVKNPAPQLDVSPIVPTLPVLQNGTANLLVTIRNAGTAVLTNVVLTPPPHLPWLSLSTTALPNLAVGQSATFTMTATPPGTLTTGEYRDRVWVYGQGVEPQSIMLTVQLLGPARDLHFTISNTMGVSVSNALIQMQRTTPSVVVTEGSAQTTYKFASGTSNANGELTLSNLEVGEYMYLAQAIDHSPVTGTLTLETGSGPQATVIMLPALPRLSIEPNVISMTVTRGQQDFREVFVRNLGAAPLTNVAITTPQTMPWTSYGVVGDMNVISPNQAAPVLIYANPTLSQTPGLYQDYLLAGSGNGGSAAAALHVDVKDTLTRTVIFAVSDTITNSVAGADVLLTREEPTLLVTQGVTHAISSTLSGLTGPNGQARFDGLAAGIYRYQINALSHDVYDGVIAIEPSPDPLTIPVELTYYPFHYDWSVIPTTITDTYSVTLRLTYDTSAPVPTMYVWGDTVDRAVCDPGSDTVVYHAHNPVIISQTLVSVAGTVISREIGPLQSASFTVTVPSAQCGHNDPHAVVSYPKAVGGPTYTFNPSSFTSQLLTPTQVFAYEYMLEVVNPFEGVTLEIGKPSALTWISMPNPYADVPLYLPTGTPLPLVLTATVPGWLAEGVYTDTIPITLHGPDGFTKNSWLTVVATQTPEGLRLHTAFDPGALMYTRAQYNVHAPFGVRGCGCGGSSGGGGWVVTGGAGGIVYTWLAPYGFGSPPLHGAPPPVYSYGHQQVRIEINQDLLLEREAFIATLGLTNTFTQSLQNMQVMIVISNATGTQVTQHFAITPTLPTTLGDILVGQGKRSQWTLVPGDLNITDANGQKFYVSAIMSYTVGGESFAIHTLAREITVKPQPKLVLDYYVPGPGAICTQFPLQVKVTNQGYGWARNLKIASAQPRLYDNPSGLLIGFNILSATLGNQVIPNGSLTIPFGDLAPGEKKEGSWLLQSTLPGHFVEFWADFKHNDYLGLPLSPLIEEINTYIVTPGLTEYERMNRNRESIFLAAQTAAQAGRGVSTFSGYYSENEQDFSIDTRGLPLKFERSYNSASGTETGPLGYGWSHNYEMKLQHDLGENMSLVTGRGSSMRFISLGGGNFLPAPGVRAELVRGPEGVYTLTQVSQVRYTFNTTGTLLAEIDNNGNRNTAIYSGTQLTGVRAPDGRELHFAYNTDKRLVTVTDPIARAIRFGYDAQGNLSVVTNTLGFTTSFTYDDKHRLTRMTDANGHTVVANEYDDKGRVTRQLDGLNQATRFGYKFEDCTLGRTVVITNTRGFTRTDVYAPRGELDRQIDAYGNVISYTYDLNFNVASITDKNGHMTRHISDVRGNPLHTTNALSNVITNTYDSHFNLTTQIDALGRMTRKDYDVFGNVLTTTDALSGTTVNVYDQYGQLIKAVDQAGHVTQYGYNVYGQQTVITDALGHPTYKFYDLAGRVISTSNALGQVTAYQYDAGSRIVQITDAAGYTTTRQYDAVNNVLAERDANGHATRYGYDANNRAITVTDALSGTTRYAYDPQGNQIRVTNAEGYVTMQEYDALDRSIRTTDALSNTTITAYDPVGNEIAETDARGNTTRTIYDALNRPVTVTNPLSGTTVTRYDAVGNRLEVIEPAGHPTQYTYDALNRTLAITDALGYVARTEYDLVGNQIAVTDTRGSVTRFAYDALKRNVIMTDVAGSAAHMTYDALGNQIVLTDARGFATRLGYDRLNRVVVVTDVLNNATRYVYDRAGNRTGVVDGRGYTTTFEFDALNRLITLTGPLTRTVYTYDRLGNPRSITDKRGATTWLAYDALGRIITTTDALGGQATVQYDANGNRLSLRDAAGRVVRTAYDALNRPIVITNALGYASHTAYDALGNRVAVTDTRGFATRYEYDVLNRLITTTNALNGQTIQHYDAGGNLLSLQDAAGRVLRKEYDVAGRVITVTDPLSGTTIYAYDVSGNRISERNANGQVTLSGFDPLNRISVMTDALGFTSHTRYDAVGNQLVVTGTRGFVTHYAYDAASRVISTTDALGQVTAYEYDVAGNKTRLIDARGHSTTFDYDLLGHLLTMTSPLNTVTTYGYDAVGNRIRLTDANAQTTHYAYDALNRVITTTDAVGKLAVTTYDAAGNLLAERDPNGNVTRYGYDALNRRVVLTDALQGRTLYTFDAVGNQLSATDANGHAIRYAYDGLDHVIAITNALGHSAYKFYDAVGNVISETDGLGRVTTYAYDALNRVITTTDAANSQMVSSYDAAGNVIARTDAEGRVTRLAYDALNQVITTTNALSQSVIVRYDPLGNTIAETDTLGRTRRYEYDALNRSTVVTDALGYVSRTEYDAVDNPIATIDPLGQITRYGYDALNRQVVMTDAVQGLTTVSYDAAGNPIARTDPEGRITRFAYDALHRLITTTDALSGTLVNVYDAVGNPIGEIDPEGHVMRLAYDAANQPITVTDALSNVMTVTYDAVGNQIAKTDAEGRTTIYVYDALNRVITTTDPLSGTQGLRYDRVGNLLARTDAAGRTTTSIYDALNKPLTVTNALGGQTIYEYNAVGQIIRQIDPEQHATTFVYDALNRVVIITDTLNHSTRFGYDAIGNRTIVTDARGSTGRTIYDALGRVIRQIDPLGHAKQYAYDRVGNQVVVTDASGIPQFNTFDALNRPIEVRDALGQATRYSYDRVGNPRVITDANGVATFNEYDALNRLTAVLENYQPGQPASASVNVRTSYAFDRVGNRTVITDANGHASHNVYDALNRIIVTADPLTQTYRFQYDQVGNLIGRLDANGITTTFDYDALNRVSRVIYPESTVAFQYDRMGNRLVMTDALGVSRYAYDALYRLTYSSDPYTGTLRYGYDEVGNRTVITYPSGQASTYAYDAASRLISMRDWLTGTTTYTYDPAGRVLTTTLPNGTSTINAYDLAGYPIRTIHYDAAQGVLADYQYELDGLGNRVVATETLRMPSGDHPFADFNASPLLGAAPLTVTFSTLSSGIIDTYRWSFGDGVTSTLMNPVHVYAAVGAYTVSLFVSGPEGSDVLTRANYISVTATTPPPPVADFSATPLSGVAPLDVTFSNASTGAITGYMWSFGDGTTDTATNPAHQYAAAGVYTISLTTSGPGGSHTLTRTNYITVTSGSVLPPGVYFMDNMENGGGNWNANTGWVLQHNDFHSYNTAWALNATAALAAEAAALDSSLTLAKSVAIPLTATQPELSYFTHFTLTGTALVKAEVSTDGSVWTPILTQTATANQTAYAMQRASLQNYIGQSVLLRFYLAQGTASDQWFIDDVFVGEGVPSAKIYLPLLLRSAGLPLSIEGAFNLLPADRASDTLVSGVDLWVMAQAQVDRLWRLQLVAWRAASHNRGAAKALMSLPVPTRPVAAPTAPITRTVTIHYTYDPLSRLAAASYSSGSVYSYTYDAVGNRLTQNVQGAVTHYAYDAANRLTSVNGAAYTFDANGNQLSDGVRTFTYDTANRLTSVVSGTHTTQYAYNGVGTRLAQIVDGATTHYVVDVSGQLPHVTEEHSASGVTRYLYASGLIGSERNGTRAYQHGDALGSVRQTTNEAGVVQQVVDYDPFGNVTRAIGVSSSSFGYAREQHDTASGLIFLRARYYDPTLGRFLNRDTYPAYAPAPQTLHRYVYVKNNPINHTDPSGLCSRWDVLCKAREAANSVSNTVQRGWNTVTNTAQRGWNTVTNTVQRGWNTATNTVQRAWNTATNTVQRAWNTATSTAQRAWNTVTNTAQRAWNDATEYVGRKAAELDHTVRQVAAEIERGAGELMRNETARMALGVGLIVGATVMTGGAALVPILIGGAIGAGIDYGFQVYENYQNGLTGSDAWTQINLSRMGKAAFTGMVSAAAATLIAPLLPGAGVGAAGILKVGVAEVISGRVSQIAANVVNGDPWNQDLGNLRDIALDFLPAVGGATFKAVRQANMPHVGGSVPPAGSVTPGHSRVPDTTPRVEASAPHALGGTPTLSRADATPSVKEYAPGTICSFSANTAVTTKVGLRAISTLNVGDQVLAYDETSSTTGVYTVTAVLQHEDPVVTYLVIDGERIETTPEHPFYTQERGWVAARDLWIGAHVRKADGTLGVVESIGSAYRPQQMYNLTVAEAHTFFVGEQQWLVHNECPKVHSVYADGTPVFEGQQPRRLGAPVPLADATGPHAALRWDTTNNRIYQAREFDAAGHPVRDIDFTNPTYASGQVRPGHAGPPHQHRWVLNDPTNPRSGYKRLTENELLPEMRPQWEQDWHSWRDPQTGRFANKPSGVSEPIEVRNLRAAGQGQFAVSPDTPSYSRYDTRYGHRWSDAGEAFGRMNPNQVDTIAEHVRLTGEEITVAGGWAETELGVRNRISAHQASNGARVDVDEFGVPWWRNTGAPTSGLPHTTPDLDIWTPSGVEPSDAALDMLRTNFGNPTQVDNYNRYPEWGTQRPHGSLTFTLIDGRVVVERNWAPWQVINRP
ncbi:partial putative deoxyribonuclease RhsB, partial [Thermoflexales bacterium]